jgi:hypothetical protein
LFTDEKGFWTVVATHPHVHVPCDGIAFELSRLAQLIHFSSERPNFWGRSALQYPRLDEPKAIVFFLTLECCCRVSRVLYYFGCRAKRQYITSICEQELTLSLSDENEALASF